MLAGWESLSAPDKLKIELEYRIEQRASAIRNYRRSDAPQYRRLAEQMAERILQLEYLISRYERAAKLKKN